MGFKIQLPLYCWVNVVKANVKEASLNHKSAGTLFYSRLWRSVLVFLVNTGWPAWAENVYRNCSIWTEHGLIFFFFRQALQTAQIGSIRNIFFKTGITCTATGKSLQVSELFEYRFSGRRLSHLFFFFVLHQQ